ncbi:MlaD family protein [Nocardia bovistercoris]|nr:MlaD family protein [Nocardia bovistercoris]
MLTRILGSRGLMSAAVIVVFALVAVIGFTLARPEPDTRTYCADMPDSIGLYKGSAVTVLGIEVGKVTEIAPEGSSARVRFTVREDRALPLDVGAVTVSDTIIADRELELVGAEPADGPGWDPAQCITKTLTPLSFSRTFNALAQLTDQINGAQDPAQRDALGSGLESLDKATAGSGAQLNALIEQLGRALASPNAAIGHVGALIDAIAELAHRARGGWGKVETIVTELPQTFYDIVTIAFPPIVKLVGDLSDVLPQLNDVVTMLGTPAVRAVGSIENLPQLLAAGVGSLTELLGRTPAIAGGFASAVDPATGKATVAYAPPALAVPEQQASQVCAALQTITGQPCPAAAGGAVAVPALPVLLGAVSAR